MGLQKFFKKKKNKRQPLEVSESSTADYLNSPSHAFPMSPASTNECVESYDIEQVVRASNADTNVDQPNNSKTPNSPSPTTNTDYSLFVDGKPVYVVKQARGYLSIIFSSAQTIILVAMLIQCGVAPMNINPMIGPYPDALSYWGGKNAYNILYDHEYWRLFTPIMLHAGIFHLLCNVAVQLDTGAFFEREWGSLVWLIIYFASAASGSILSVIQSPNSVGVGSSGSVCGLFGAKIAEALCRSRESTKAQDRELSHAILCEQFGSTLCSVILILVFSFIPYVDWAAHVGGLLGGFSVGMMIFGIQIKTWNWRIIMFSFGFVLSLLGFASGVLHMINETKNGVADQMGDVCGHYMQYFEDYKCNCMLEEYEENE